MAFLLAAAYAYFRIGIGFYVFHLDEGAFNYGALRILDGSVPYRDFMIVTTPAHHYLLALLFKLFGVSLLLERLWQCLVLSALCAVIYAFARAALPASFAFLAWLLSVVWLGRIPHIPGPHPAALFFSFLSGFLLLGAFGGEGRRRFFWAGAAAAASLWFRQDIGVSTVLAGLFLWPASPRPPRAAAAYLSGLLLILLPPAAYFLSVASPHDLFYDFFVYPLRIYPHVSALLYPAFFELPARPLPLSAWPAYFLREASLGPAFYLPFAVFLCSLGRLLAGLRGARDGLFRWTLFLTLLGVFFLGQLFMRSDGMHLTPAYLAAALLFAALFAGAWRAARLRALSAVFVLAAACLVWSPLFRKAVVAGLDDPLPMRLPRAQGIFPHPLTGLDAARLRDYRRTVGYIRHKVPRGQKIFVGSVRHDRVCLGDPLFYFLSERDSATKYHELHRGHVTQEAVQREIAAELEKNDVRFVVLRKYLDLCCQEPNASVEGGGSGFLDDYLRRRFVLDRAFSENFVLKRKV